MICFAVAFSSKDTLLGPGAPRLAWPIVDDVGGGSHAFHNELPVEIGINGSCAPEDSELALGCTEKSETALGPAE